MATDLHFDDLLRIVTEAGLDDDSFLDDATAWIEQRGLCAPAISQYGEGIVDTAVEIEGGLTRHAAEGIFTSGLTLGIAIAEARGAGDAAATWPPEWWFHEKHGLHDEAHHQAHDPMHLCVPLNAARPPGPGEADAP